MSTICAAQLGTLAATKRAFSPVKQAATVEKAFPVRVMPAESSERSLIGDTAGEGPSLKTERATAKYMTSAQPVALDNVIVSLNGLDGEKAHQRAIANPRNGPLGRLYSYIQGPELKNSYPWDFQSGPFYMPLSDMVQQSWNAPGTTVHELGHAIDYNQGKVPDSKLGRFGKGLLRDMYMFAPVPGMTLWKEHAAWRKGQDAYIRGAAMHKAKLEEVAKTIENAQRSKYPALGTYWGSSLGALGGLGAAIGMAYGGVPPHLAAAAIPVGGALGLGAGMGTGMIIRHLVADRVVERLKKKYPDLVAEYEERAKAEKKERKKPALRKAAAGPAPGQSFAMRGLLGQLRHPQWDAQAGLLHNVMGNLQSAYNRGQRLVQERDWINDMKVSDNPELSLHLLTERLQGNDPVVKHPVDQVLYRSQ